MPQGPPFFRARARLPVLGAPASFPFLTQEAHTLTYTSGESRLLAVSDLSLSVSCHLRGVSKEFSGASHWFCDSLLNTLSASAQAEE